MGDRNTAPKRGEDLTVEERVERLEERMYLIEQRVAALVAEDGA